MIVHSTCQHSTTWWSDRRLRLLRRKESRRKTQRSPLCCTCELPLLAECNTRQPYAWTKPIKMIRGFARCPCRTGYFCAPVRRGSRRGESLSSSSSSSALLLSSPSLSPASFSISPSSLSLSSPASLFLSPSSLSLSSPASFFYHHHRYHYYHQHCFI